MRLFTSISLLLLLAVGPLCTAAELTAIKQPELSRESFWASALGSRPKPEVEVVTNVQCNGVSIQAIRYTGSLWRDIPQRVAALYAHPEGPGPFPAILQIHGGGQTCYPENVAYFVNHGYACLSFDWTGPRPGRSDELVTHWSKPILGNYFGGDAQDPKEVLIYHATLGAIGAIDVLASRPEVDRERIGVQGISWGGFLTWLVNGLDPRIKAAVPVYGLGNLDLQWNDMGAALARLGAERRVLWRELFDPASFTTCQHGPLLYVDAANDFFGPLDLAELRLAQLQVEHRRSYAPNRMHNLDEGVVKAGMAWLDAHLKSTQATFPAAPEMDFETNSAREFVVSVRPDPAQTPRGVRLDFSRGDQLPLLRCWLSVDASPGGDGCWKAAIPLVDATQKISIMAQALYDSGMMLTSPVQEFRPGVKLPSRPRASTIPNGNIVDPDDPLGGLYIVTGTDFIHADPFPGQLVRGEIDGRRGFLFVPREQGASARFATRRMVDSGTRPGGTAQLEINTHDTVRLRVRINNFLREPGAEAWQATVTPGAGWQRTVVSLSDFPGFDEAKEQVVTSPDRTLHNWNETHQMEFICEPVSGGKIGLGKVSWVDSSNPPSADLK